MLGIAVGSGGLLAVLVGVYLIWWDGALRVVLIWLVGLVLLVWFGCVALM